MLIISIFQCSFVVFTIEGSIFLLADNLAICKNIQNNKYLEYMRISPFGMQTNTFPVLKWSMQSSIATIF